MLFLFIKLGRVGKSMFLAENNESDATGENNR